MGMAIKLPSDPGSINTLKNFRLTPTRIVRRGVVCEAVWDFVTPHRPHAADAEQFKQSHLPYAEFQSIRQSLGAELGIGVADDGLWNCLPAYGEIVFDSGIPWDASELRPRHVIDPNREPFTQLANTGILPGVVSAQHPDRAYSQGLYFFLRAFLNLSLLTDKALASLCKEFGCTTWRSAALHGMRFPPLREFRRSILIRYPDMKFTNDRAEWSTH
jgi:hypothetical protein